MHYNALKTIYYNGTQDQWNKITKSEYGVWSVDNSPSIPATATVIFTDGQITLTA